MLSARYDLDFFFKTKGIVKNIQELEKIDFRMDEVILAPHLNPIYRVEVWGKMVLDPRNPHSVWSAYNAQGFRALMELTRNLTVGEPAYLNGKGKVVFPAKKPIAKAVHFIWQAWGVTDTLLKIFTNGRIRKATINNVHKSWHGFVKENPRPYGFPDDLWNLILEKVKRDESKNED